jgi:hypothetical protein
MYMMTTWGMYSKDESLASGLTQAWRWDMLEDWG